MRPDRAHVCSVLGAVVAVGLAVRLAVILAAPEVGPYLSMGIPHRHPSPPSDRWAYLDRRTDWIWYTEDEHAYDEMAQSALRGEGFTTRGGWMVAPPGKPTSYGGFVYPAFVTATYALAGGSHQLPVFVLQAGIGAAGAIPVFLLGLRFFGAVGGLLAAALYALAPPLVWSSVAMMSEALFVPLTVFAVWWFQRAWDSQRGWDWAGAGAAFALAALTRSTIFYFLPITVLGYLAAQGLNSRALRRLAWFGVTFGLCVAPWTYRNWLVHGRFLLLDSKGGAALWQYNNPNLVPELGRRAAAGAPPVPIVPEQTLRDVGNEVDQGRRYARMAVAYIREQPGHFLAVAACRAVLALSPVPLTNPTPLNVAVGLGFKGPLLVLAVMGWFHLRRRWREAWLLLSLPIYWWALQSLSGPGHRYRLPVEFAYLILAAGGTLAVVGRGRWGRADSAEGRFDPRHLDGPDDDLSR